jgi:hypothetical protein
VQQYQRRTLPSVSVGHGMSVHLGASQLRASHVSMMPPYGTQREVTICQSENDPHAKSREGGFYSGPSEAVQHLPEGIRPDLDGPREGVVELGDGEEYAADDQRQGSDNKRVRHVALQPE